MHERTKYQSAAKLVADSWAHWAHLIYVVALISTWLLAGFANPTDVRVTIAYVGLVGYVFVLMTFCAYFILSYSRKARYAEAFASVNAAILQIGALAVHLDQCLKNEVRYETAETLSALRTILGSVVNAFNIATAVGNRCCIKLLGRDTSDREYVRTLCRDPVSHEVNRVKDESEGITHLVDKNTDFMLILRGEHEYFLCDDVSKYPHYRNTSPEGSTGANGLPYASTLVLPISRSSIALIDRSEMEGRASIYGFLAIDARARRAYERRFDVHVAAVISNALYPIFMQMERLELSKQAIKK